VNAYFDSSAIVKLLVPERGSDTAAEVWEHSLARISSVVAFAEVRAALATAQGLRRITVRTARRAVRELDELWQLIASITADDAIARLAGELAEHQALRGFDAVHLASALAAQEGEYVLVTWDRDLHAAAARCGLVVAPAVL
jgi:predicted nucleic acid-binding protein